MKNGGTLTIFKIINLFGEDFANFFVSFVQIVCPNFLNYDLFKIRVVSNALLTNFMGNFFKIMGHFSNLFQLPHITINLCLIFAFKSSPTPAKHKPHQMLETIIALAEERMG